MTMATSPSGDASAAAVSSPQVPIVSSPDLNLMTRSHRGQCETPLTAQAPHATSTNGYVSSSGGTEHDSDDGSGLCAIQIVGNTPDKSSVKTEIEILATDADTMDMAAQSTDNIEPRFASAPSASQAAVSSQNPSEDPHPLTNGSSSSFASSADVRLLHPSNVTHNNVEEHRSVAASTTNDLPCTPPTEPHDTSDTAPLVVAPDQFGLMDSFDASQYCVEDLAFLYENEPQHLQPLQPPGPIPPLPNTGSCLWEWQDSHRYVLKATFLTKTLHPKDTDFLWKVYDSTHVTVILKNVFPTFNAQLWAMSRLTSATTGDYHHKFRRFDYNRDTGEHEERDGSLSMLVSEFFRYLQEKEHVEKQVAENPDAKHRTFTFTPLGKAPVTVDLLETVLYMIDYDLVECLPFHHADFENNFLLKDILPGKERCMMSAIHKGGQPFMGPNLYATPAASYTQFHQDGNGTVDSTHVCLRGVNEVVILRRLPQAHKLNALSLLGVKKPQQYLCREPHADNLRKPDWPSRGQIEGCRKWGYCPAVLSLEPGECILISKGALHAFRKMPNVRFPPDSHDCHAELRNAILDREGYKHDGVCVSIAWDWSYMGSTGPGTNREVTAALENGALNEICRQQSLGVTETMVLLLSKHLVNRFEQESSFQSLISAERSQAGLERNLEDLEKLRGLLPALEYIVENQTNCQKDAAQSGRKARGLAICGMPDASQNPELCKIDAFGNGSYRCEHCRGELSNVYFHCRGCEELLESDYNICMDCHRNRCYESFVKVHRFSTKQNSAVNHCGHFMINQATRCKCKVALCKSCKLCTHCSCSCHKAFELHNRFFDQAQLADLLASVRAAVGDRKVAYAPEAIERLRLVRERVGEAKRAEARRVKRADASKRAQAREAEAARKEAETAQTNAEAAKRTDTKEGSSAARSRVVNPSEPEKRSGSCSTEKQSTPPTVLASKVSTPLSSAGAQAVCAGNSGRGKRRRGTTTTDTWSEPIQPVKVASRKRNADAPGRAVAGVALSTRSQDDPSQRQRISDDTAGMNLDASSQSISVANDTETPLGLSTEGTSMLSPSACAHAKLHCSV